MANYKIDPKDFHWNVAFLDGKQYEGQVDLFVGGSPCQSFSLVGKQRGLEDTRGTLFYEYARQTYNAIESRRREMNWAIYCSLLLYFDYHPHTHNIIHQLNIFPSWLENTRLYIDANE